MKQKFLIIPLLALYLSEVSCGGHGRRTEQNVTQQAEPPQEVVAEETTSEEPQSPVVEEIKPFNLKLYIENSGSMDGYVNGSHDFKNAIYSYVSDISQNINIQNISLNFINSKIINKGSNIDSFFYGLNSSQTFVKAGGVRKASDISQVLKSVIDNSNNEDVCILVSDFIFSPGKGKNAVEYLKDQQIQIKNIFVDFLKNNPNCGLMFFQLSSNFSGTFYDRQDSKFTLKNTDRPFYMLVLGNADYLSQIRKNIPENTIKGSGVKNSFITQNQFLTPEYCIVNRSGDFERSKNNPKHAIANAKKGRDGNLTFAVETTFNNAILDENYLLNPENYTLSDKQFSISTKKFSDKYHLTFSSPVVKQKITLSIKLNKKIPQWIYDFNDDEGLGQQSSVSGKTYGLKNIIEGITEAFNFKNGSYYTELLIDINK